MNVLPPLEHGDRRYWLPLVDVTAVGLAAAIVETGEDARCSLFAETLEHDPALLLWTVCRAWLTNQQSFAEMPEAARWLAANFARQLRFATPDVQDAATSKRNHEVWRKLAAESFASHSLAGNISDEEIDETRSGNANLVAHFLPNAAEWLNAASDADQPLSRIELVALLPPNLRTSSQSQRPAAAGVDGRVSDWCQAVPWAARLLQPLLRQYGTWQKAEQDLVDQLHRAKLASLKEFAYGASHELNNPLFNISSRAQVLLREESDPERRKKLSTIYSHALRASEMIKEMALAAHPPRPEWGLCDLPRVVQMVADELRPIAQEQAVRIEVTNKVRELKLSGDEIQLGVALRAVCLNSIEALGRAGKSGTIVMEVSRENAPDSGATAAVKVHDDGPGLDARARLHLFDPFFSGYEAGRGLGFGLSKCWQIIDAHGGQIEVHSHPGCGTEITLRLPVVTQAAQIRPLLNT